MKIEFRKVPTQPKDFIFELNSVKFCGTLDKISSRLVNINSNIDGTVDVQCCKCGLGFDVLFNEDINFLVSDGAYTLDDERDLDKIIIESNDHFINFEEILQSELESFRSDYYVCDSCSKDQNSIEIEY